MGCSELESRQPLTLMLHSLSAPLWWWWICHLAGIAWKCGAEIHVELVSWRADQSRGLSIGLGGSWDGCCLGYADRLLWARYLTSVYSAFSFCKRRLISLFMDVGVFSGTGLGNNILMPTWKVLGDSVKVYKALWMCVGLGVTLHMPCYQNVYIWLAPYIKYRFILFSALLKNVEVLVIFSLI